MPATLKQRIEGYLYRRGFTEPVLREVMLVQLAVAAALLLLALAFIWLTDWFLFCFAGSLLVTCNFWFLCRFIFRHFSGGYSGSFALRQILLFGGRFILTALLLAWILLSGGSPSALLAGLGTCVAVIIATALLRFRAIQH
jgi:small-conductance mechanosensitive channel